MISASPNRFAMKTDMSFGGCGRPRADPRPALVYAPTHLEALNRNRWPIAVGSTPVTFFEVAVR